MATAELAVPIRVEPMLAADIGDGLQLGAEAGWNQVAADWQIMLACGEGFCVRDSAGDAIATCIVLPYAEGGLGWVSMVLVHTAFRKRGLATMLLGRAIDALQAKGLVPMLDASPAGRQVYEPMGFRALEEISRWRGQGGAATPLKATRLSADDVAAFAAADGAAFGAFRPKLIENLLLRPDAHTAVSRQEGAWLLSRGGRVATQIGPLIAEDGGAAARALGTAIDALSGPVLLDMPDREYGLAALTAARGFHVERRFTRMALADEPPAARHQSMQIIAGPELG